MKIGLPRALLYHKYSRLWSGFFEELGQDVVISPATDKAIMRDGQTASADECCLPAKIYLGHVKWLTDKCDRVFVPRIGGFGKNEKVCVKFNGLYDIAANTLAPKLLRCNVDYEKGIGEKDGFIEAGKQLGFNRRQALRAYRAAKRLQEEEDKANFEKELAALDTDKKKIMVVSHAYNMCDPMVGAPVIRLINDMGGAVICADKLGCFCASSAQKLTKSLYWKFNKELAGALAEYAQRVDGVIFVTAFPCGTDSLATELIMRRLKGVPSAHIVVDELQSEVGLLTRIESFMDIIEK